MWRWKLFDSQKNAQWVREVDKFTGESPVVFTKCFANLELKLVWEYEIRLSDSYNQSLQQIITVSRCMKAICGKWV